jgi:hypothetical protein
MTTLPDKITFMPRRLKDDTEWCVVATYPTGHREHITGFKSEAEALDWIASDRCQTWLKTRRH